MTQENFTTQEEEAEEPENADVTVRSGMRIAALEQLVEELKQANQVLIAEMDEMGGDAAAAAGGAGPGSILALKEALANERNLRTTALENLENAKQEMQELAEKMDTLEEDLFRLRGDIGTGRHVPPTARVMEFSNNPAAKWFGRREEDLEKLKKENEALRSMIGDNSNVPAQTAATEGFVPRATLDVLMEEKELLEKEIKDKDKRLLRLREVILLIYILLNKDRTVAN
jgi:mitotic spindle assembly checkpoint protein MAD1